MLTNFKISHIITKNQQTVYKTPFVAAILAVHIVRLLQPPSPYGGLNMHSEVVHATFPTTIWVLEKIAKTQKKLNFFTLERVAFLVVYQLFCTK